MISNREIIGDLPQGGTHIIERHYLPGVDEPDVIEKVVYDDISPDSWQPSHATDLNRLSNETNLLLGRFAMPQRLEMEWKPRLANYDDLDAITPPPHCTPTFTATFNGENQTYLVEASLPLSKKVTGITVRGLGMSVVHYEVALPPEGFALWPIRVYHAERQYWIGEGPRQTKHSYPQKMTAIGAVSCLQQTLYDLRNGASFGGGNGKIKVGAR